jgi:YVTN family beta-propeller protein
MKAMNGEGSRLPGRALRRRGVMFASALLLAALSTTAVRSAGEDFRVKLRAGTFDPALGLPPHLVEGAPPPVLLAPPGGRGELAIVQFRATPSAAEQSRLAALGMRVIDYVPERALIVRLAPGTSPDSLRSIPGVRAVIPLAPKLRLSPDLGELARSMPPVSGSEELRINVWLAPDGDPRALADAAQKKFPGVVAASIRREPASRVQFSGSTESLDALAAALARHPDVLFVGLARPNHVLNDQSIWIGQSYDRVNGPVEAASSDPKAYTLSGSVFNHGITGTGQVVGVADTRLEHQLCFFTDPAHPLVKQTVPIPDPLTVDPNHRKILAYNNVISDADDPPYPTWRHGTHTTGSALADSLANLSSPSSAGHDTGDGMAPNAKLVYLDMNLGVNTSNCTDLICAFCSVADILQQEYEAGARISTNSWGSDTSAGDEADDAVWQRPDHLVFFAAGNDGRSGYPVEGTAGAKNVVGVGATESYDATFNYDAYGIRDPENLAAFTSVGPAWDGRTKPDITAPGVVISSAGLPFTYYGDASDPHCVPGDPNVCFPSFGGCYVNDVSQTCSTVKLSGTSMASPTAAGLGALARQYFTDGFYPSGQATPADARIPSAALLKAVLINGARDMTGRILDGNGNFPRTDFGPLADAPSNRQGWGRIMLDDALYFAGDVRKLFLADIPSAQGSGLATGDLTIYRVNVTSASSPLKVTLVWTDPPAAPVSGISLRNDLDLIVIAPDGTTTYKGNQWTADDINIPGDKRSAPNPGGRDSLNNVEGVLIPSPSLGQYRIEIKGASVPGYQTLFTQGYAMVVTGEFNGGGDYCGATPPPPQGFAASVLRYDDALLTWQAVPGATGYEIWRHTTGCAPPLDPATVFSVPAGQTSYHDRTTQPSRTYYYTIRALLNPVDCRTTASDCVSATTPSPPTIQTVSPESGANNDATPISITGTGFQATPQVYLGTASQPQKYPLSPVTFVSSTTVRATVPVNLQSGGYSVMVINPDGLSATLAGGYYVGPPLQFTTLYIAADSTDYYAADQLTVINLEQSTVQAPVTLTPFDDPVDVAVNRATDRGVIGLFGAGPSGERGRVAIMNLGLGAVTHTLDVPGATQGRRPYAVAIHPSGNPAYVLTGICCAGSSQQLSRLDFSTGTFTGTLTLGNYGDVSEADIEVSPDGQRLYATNSGDDTLSVVRTSDFVEIARVPVGNGPVGVAVSPDSTKVYVTDFLGDSVSIVDAVSQATVGTIDVSYHPNPSWTTRPKHAAVSPDGSKLHVAFENGWGTLLWNVATVDLATGQITQTLTVGEQFEKIAYVSPLGKLFALAFSPDIKRLAPATLQVEWSQNVGAYAFGMDWAEPTPPTITSASPNQACKNGGIPVAIVGSAFQGEIRDDSGTIVQQRTRVFFGGVEATTVTFVDSTHLTAVAPPHAAGTVNLEVLNPNGRRATLTNGFRYRNCITPAE